jgi:hypothetical protein
LFWVSVQNPLKPKKKINHSNLLSGHRRRFNQLLRDPADELQSRIGADVLHPVRQRTGAHVDSHAVPTQTHRGPVPTLLKSFSSSLTLKKNKLG